MADRAKIRNGSYPDRAKAWSKFAVQGVKLGVPFETVPGFTCGPPPGTDGFTTQNHSCVKFIDARCKGKPTQIKMIRGMSDVPKGQSSFMDEFMGATYLDRKQGDAAALGGPHHRDPHHRAAGLRDQLDVRRG